MRVGVGRYKRRRAHASSCVEVNAWRRLETSTVCSIRGGGNETSLAF